MREIGHRTFTDEDQQLFASVSGDCNPMHVSSVAARRLITGRQVVHGIHLLTTALEHWYKAETVVPVSIACSFSNPVSVGDRVLFTQTDRSDGTFVIEALVNSLLCSRILIGTAPGGTQNAPNGVHPQPTPGAMPGASERLSTPLDLPPESHIGKSYAIGLKSGGVASRFPHSCSCLGEKSVAALLGLSYFVGMVCPGLHSIFSSLALRLVPDGVGENALTISVDSYDARFGLFNCSVSGCMHGSVKAFLRPAPQQQPTVCEVAQRVDPGEFKGTRSLVIGGSRGLGETTAKVLAAGGGNVIITFATGRIEAGKICEEINFAGLGRCEIAKLDLTTDSLDSLPVDVDSLDAVFYFPTPRIARKKSALFGRELFQEFCTYYIDKFHDLCAFLDANLKQRRTTVYYPSSVFVAERPSGMTEYAMAKAAAEVLIDEINRYAKRVFIVATRLPRLSTDQTASILRLTTADNLETLLPVVRSVIETVRNNR
jgi:NAD(P)-dependent dehydrogenase (short-subunit alcohol dehydrogenase family)